MEADRLAELVNRYIWLLNGLAEETAQRLGSLGALTATDLRLLVEAHIAPRSEGMASLSWHVPLLPEARRGIESLVDAPRPGPAAAVAAAV